MMGAPPTMGHNANTSKEPKGILDGKIRTGREKAFNPLVICGPPCSGKTILIEHFIFHQPELFIFAKPYSSSLGSG